MTKLIGFLLCIFAVGGLAAGCLSSTPSPTESPLPFISPVQTQPSRITVSPTKVATMKAATEAPISVKVPVEAPVPEEGKASVTGVLYTFSGHGPIPKTVFYLTPAVGKEKRNPPSIFVGPRKEHGDIQGMSDAQGRIFLNNIPPGNYYLAVWAPYNWILAVESESDPTPRLIVLEPNQRANLGIIYLSWP